MKKIIISLISAIVLTFAIFCVLFFIALQRGPSIDTLSKRVCQSLMVDPASIRYLGGKNGREPSVFFELSGNIHETADVRVLKGWAKDHNVRLFNNLALAHGIPYNATDDLLNYKGDIYDLYLVKTASGYCVLYYGF